MTRIPRTRSDGLLGADAAYRIASRASNLAEQVRIARELSPPGRAGASGVSALPDPPDLALSGVDRWRIQRLARRLSAPRGGPVGRAAPPWPDGALPGELEAVLTLNRLLQQRSHCLRPEERALLLDVHVSWLPTYLAAVRGFDPATRPADPVDADPVDAGGNRRWLDLVSAPFRALLLRELRVSVAAANWASGRELIGEEFIGAFERHLVARFELAIAWAVEADQNVALARLGIAPERATTRDHHDYFDRTFRDGAAYHDFFLRFPVLARGLATVTRQLCGNGQDLVERLCRDAGAIGAELIGAPVARFTSLDLGKSDYHAGGRSVALVGMATATGQSGSFVYKPRCLRSEAAMQRLLARLGADEVLGFVPRRVLVRDGYGYEQRIPADRNQVRSREQAAEVYEELGGFLALFHVLGGSDLHFENVMVAEGHVFVCDCETALGVIAPGEEPGAGTVVDSVYRTGLLEWPLPPTADVVLRLSGVAGGQSYDMPFALPRLQDGPTLAVRHETGIRVEQNAPNRVRLGDEVLDAAEFEDAIVRGFGRVHEWFHRDPARAARCVSDAFSGSPVRFVARSTQVYTQLLIGSRHPRCLMDPLEADLVFARLAEAPHPWDRDGAVAAAELRSLWQLDVPIFTVAATGTRLVHDHTEPTGVEIERSPLRRTTDRIHRSTADDRLRQAGYISASLAGTELHSPSFVATALDYACLVGAELSGALADTGRPVRWSLPAQGAEADAVQGSLYHGSAGIALFLGYLDAVAPDPRLRDAARRAITHALETTPDEIGVFQGTAGLVYVLTHLHQLWGEAVWLDQAVAHSRRLDDLVGTDRAFDVLSGCAGAIPVLLDLAAATATGTGTGAGTGLETAHRCARHLLAGAERTDQGISWPPPRPEEAVANLTGFAHGAAGIGWALVALGAATGDADYVDAGLAAFRYERSHFDRDRQDWHDLRASVLEMAKGRPHFGNAWCNGAAGIGLARLDSWVRLGRTDDELLAETCLALSATLRSFAMLGNDTLCHGRSGNAELLLRFAEARDEPAFRLEATMQAQAHWRRLAAAPGWPRADAGHQTMPGLMVGIAGEGMHFLRLAYPDRIPSPLLLDPPPSRPDSPLN